MTEVGASPALPASLASESLLDACKQPLSAPDLHAMGMHASM